MTDKILLVTVTKIEANSALEISSKATNMKRERKVFITKLIIWVILESLKFIWYSRKWVFLD